MSESDLQDTLFLIRVAAAELEDAARDYERCPNDRHKSAVLKRAAKKMRKTLRGF